MSGEYLSLAKRQHHRQQPRTGGDVARLNPTVKGNAAVISILISPAGQAELRFDFLDELSRCSA
jgi:hypothetical protein